MFSMPPSMPAQGVQRAQLERFQEFACLGFGDLGEYGHRWGGENQETGSEWGRGLMRALCA